MRRSLCLAFILVGGVAFAKGKAAHKAPAGKTVQAVIEGRSGSKLTGKAEFSQPAEGKPVTVKVTVENAPAGEHAVHLHETGDCSAPDAKSAGGHWNPGKEQHGQWGHDHFHLGDIGNMKVGDDGKGEVTLTTDKWTIATSGDNDVIGKAVVVHEKIDDFKTQPTGNAGSRLGCGVVRPSEVVK